MFKDYVFVIDNYGNGELKTAITANLEFMGAKVIDQYSPMCTHLLTRYQIGSAYEQVWLI